MPNAILVNLVALGFILYGLGRGVNAFYHWSKNNGYNEAQRYNETISKHRFENLESEVKALRKK